MSRIHLPPVAQVRALCQRYPRARKVVFVPRVQVGQAIEQAVYRSQQGGGSGTIEGRQAWGGLSCLLPRRYAEQLAARSILASGRRELQPAGRRFFVARLADELGAEAFAALPGPEHFAGSLAEAVRALRAEGVEVASAREAAGSSSASAALGIVARCYTAYEDALEHEKLYDDADVLRWATEALAASVPAETKDTVFAVLGDADLSALEAKFLRALKEAGRAFYRIGVRSPSGDSPVKMAAARFRNVPLPKVTQQQSSANGRASDRQEVSVCRAVGTGNEVRAAFQAMLAAGAPFDQVEVALAQSRPYSGIVADVAEEAEIDVTFSTGHPALQTRTGQALSGLYQWIREDFDPALLIGLFRSGLLRIDRVLDRLDAGEEWSGPTLATWLAGRRYKLGRAGYRRAFTIAEGDLEGEIVRLEEKGCDTGREETQLRRTSIAQKVVAGLFDLVPEGKTSAAEMARRSQRFLERFGPMDAPDRAEEAERSVEEAARGVLYQKLGNIRDMPVAYEASAKRIAGMLQEALERQYVRSERPRAGAVHVVPLERAAFGGRPHLYVLGLDSEAFAVPNMEEALLQELEGGLERPGEDHHTNGRASASSAAEDPADKTQWQARRALQRHAGPVHLFASVYDVESGEEQFPAAFFLEAEDASDRDTPLACFMPIPQGCAEEGGSVLIDDRTSWLAAYARGRLQPSKNHEPAAPTGRKAACARYPWLESAATARARCAADEYTLHDGFLGEGPFPELDFTAESYEGSPLSAGRLETLAETPYLYFLKYVLGIRPLDEPALEETGWLDPLQRGSILHDTFERFMKGRDESGPVHLSEEGALQEALTEALAEAKRGLAPPSERVEGAARRRLEADVRVFLHAEAEGAVSGAVPWKHEIGFGYEPRRAQEGDYDDAEITFGDELRVRLRGRVDRVDQLPTGGLAVWDYKTGSAKRYDESAPLAEGRLQWALYAYVLGAFTEKEVRTSGYFFVSTKEMGMRLAMSPARYREEVGDIIMRFGAMARAGCFPMNPKARYLSAWKWRGYEVLFPSLSERSGELNAKAENYPPDQPIPLFIEPDD